MQLAAKRHGGEKAGRLGATRDPSVFTIRLIEILGDTEGEAVFATHADAPTALSLAALPFADCG